MMLELTRSRAFSFHRFRPNPQNAQARFREPGGAPPPFLGNAFNLRNIKKQCQCTQSKILLCRDRRPRRSEPNGIIALHLIKEITLCVLDFRHIYNFMPTDRRGRRSLRIIIVFVLLYVMFVLSIRYLSALLN